MQTISPGYGYILGFNNKYSTYLFKNKFWAK